MELIMNIETRKQIERTHVSLIRPIRLPRCPSLDHGGYDDGPPLPPDDDGKRWDGDQPERYTKIIRSAVLIGSASILTGVIWKAVDLMGSTLPETDYFRTTMLPTYKWLDTAGIIAHTLLNLVDDIMLPG